MVCEVIVDIAHSDVDKIFDYGCDFKEIAIGFRVVVPFGKTMIEGIVINVKDNSSVPENKLKNVVRVIDKEAVINVEQIKLMDYMVKLYHIPKALALRQFLPSEMRKGKVREKNVDFATVNELMNVFEALSKVKPSAKNQIAVIERIFKTKKEKLSELRANFGASAVNSLIEKNVLVVSSERVNRIPYTEVEDVSKSFDFSSEQITAVNSINSTDKTVSLIHGVTGSGKTAVYINLIKSAVAEGKSAIFLVPEISLTPQMFAQLHAEFGGNCAILHSGLSKGERFDEWWRLKSGEAKVAIGARSAIFAPVENLGIIIIDEEHDGSYESESAPRYSTIEIALFRAKFNNCKLVLGSATPSIETFLAAKNGDYNLVEMTNRINKKPLPEMLIADMREEIKRGNNSAFSQVLKDELEKCLKANNQAIIFINRRGYSQKIICRECGYVAKCENCDITLNYHTVGNVLKCHYCGTTYKMLSACPECGGVHINYVGTGTQKVVEELKKLFPEAKILRMDNDTTSTKEGHFKILKQFSEKQADILVGTQMIAKGHDFPSVTLVGILDADMSLFFSDYRSSERTFQLLTQVAGRSGRAKEKGTVILQTFSPNNPVLKFAKDYDYNGFFNRECAIRRSTEYPPFATILRIMVEGDDDEKAMLTLKAIYEETLEIKQRYLDDFLFFNKMKSPIKRLKNKFRYQILMRIKQNCNALIDEIYEIASKFNSSKILVYVEKNPSSLS